MLRSLSMQQSVGQPHRYAAQDKLGPKPWAGTRLPQWHLFKRHGLSRVARASAAEDEPIIASKRNVANRSLDNLDNMLGSGSFDEELSPSLDGSSTLSTVPNLSSVPNLSAKARRRTSSTRFTFKRRTEFEVDDVIEQPRVQPLVCYFLYYFQMVAYIAYENIGYLNSSEDADDFVNAILNDHTAVQFDGEVYRLITCSFAHTDPWQLFVMLLALYTLGSELESLIGYSAFTAVYFLAVLVASSADVISGDFPVTQGASAAIAAMLAAVLAHTIKNWSFDLDVSEAKRCPSETKSSFDELEEATVSTGFDAIPFFEDVFKFTATISRRQKTVLTTLGAVIAGGRSLLDAAQMDTYTSYTGLTAGLVSGFVLSWLMSPTYKVSMEKAKPPETFRPTIVVNDQTTWIQRGLVVTIFNGALFYVVQEWVL